MNAREQKCEDVAGHMAGRGNPQRLIAVLKGAVLGREHYRKERLEAFECAFAPASESLHTGPWASTETGQIHSDVKPRT